MVSGGAVGGDLCDGIGVAAPDMELLDRVGMWAGLRVWREEGRCASTGGEIIDTLQF